MHNVGARRNPEKILAIAAYFGELGQEIFSKKSIKSKFPEAGEKAPSNYSRDFAWALKSRWIALVPDTKDDYYVTSTGKKALSEGFSKKIRGATTYKSPSGRKRRMRK